MNSFEHSKNLNVSVAIIYLDRFRIGKVNEVQESMINITLFHYKLDIKTEMVTDEDIILNFGPHQAKSIFEMNGEEQKMLLN
jgi:hypothetical protein